MRPEGRTSEWVPGTLYSSVQMVLRRSWIGPCKQDSWDPWTSHGAPGFAFGSSLCSSLSATPAEPDVDWGRRSQLKGNTGNLLSTLENHGSGFPNEALDPPLGSLICARDLESAPGCPVSPRDTGSKCETLDPRLGVSYVFEPLVRPWVSGFAPGSDTVILESPIGPCT